MEIAKFVLTCVGSVIATASFFLGMWHRYRARLEGEIDAAKKSADEEVERARRSSAEKSERLERRIEGLEKAVAELQKELNANIGERLSGIEGTMKKMDNILTQIQNWFINNTPRSQP